MLTSSTCSTDGIVGYTNTATDKAGRSIPAPGRGILSTARQLTSKYPSKNIELSYRKRQLEFRRRQISEWLDNEISLLKDECTDGDQEYYADRLDCIKKEAKRQESDALATFGMLEGADPNIAPLRKALAVWGLTIDDIGVASVSAIRHSASTELCSLTSLSHSVPRNVHQGQRQERVQRLQHAV